MWARAVSSALVVLALGGMADAGPDAADVTFQRGRTLLAQKRYAEACDAFAESQRLDPELGTLFNIADCESRIGKLASAWTIYRQLARTDTNHERRDLSAKAAADLAARVPKLVIAVAASPPDLHVTLDGADTTSLVGLEIPVDLGSHAIAASATGYRATAATAAVTTEGKVVRVELKLARVAPIAAVAPPPAPVAASVALPAPPPSSRETARPWLGRAGWIGMWSGAGLFVAGLAVGGAAWGTYRGAEHCTSCDRAGRSHTAVGLGDASTALVIVGLAAAGAGVYLWRTNRSSAQVVAAPTGIALAGSF